MLVFVSSPNIRAMSDTVQAIVEGDKVMLFQDDYCESAGCCYSRVDLTRADIEQLLAALQPGGK